MESEFKPPPKKATKTCDGTKTWAVSSMLYLETSEYRITHTLKTATLAK